MAKVVLIILDGWGWSSQSDGNAILHAKTPTIDYIATHYPTTALHAASNEVGLPNGTMGNSEVGATCIGSGRVVLQDFPQISESITNGSFFKNNALDKIVKKSLNHTLHLVGLASDAGVHGDYRHILACVKKAKDLGAKDVQLHLITDGRDSSPKSAKKILTIIDAELNKLQLGKIVSIVGRYYAMDRDRKYDRTKLAYDLISSAQGRKVDSWQEALDTAYSSKESDEFIKPVLIGTADNIDDDDSIIFTNFRADRMIQLARSFSDKSFSYFHRKSFVNCAMASMTEYDHSLGISPIFSIIDLNNPRSNPLTNPLGSIISKKGLSQLRAAESEKYAHVTYFFNAGYNHRYPKESRILVPSPKVAAYDAIPGMSINRLVIKIMSSWKHHFPDFTVINFANADMVGHTGNYSVTIKACQQVDNSVAKIVHFSQIMGATILLTADHGNAEQMIDPLSGDVDKEHTINPVPIHIINPELQIPKLLSPISIKSKNIYQSISPTGLLADIAPTVLELLEINPPNEMTGQSLLTYLR